MAKFRNGNLVLQSTQQLIQGSDTLIDANGVAEFSSLDLNSTTAVTSIQDTLTDSSTAVPTSHAVYSQIAGLSLNSIYQNDSKVEVLDDDISPGTVTFTVDGTEVGQFTETSQRVGTVDSYILVDTTSSVFVPSGMVESFRINADGITLENGATIDEFSIDGTLADNSDTAVPTEKAVRTYVTTYVNNALNFSAGVDNSIARYDGTTGIQTSLVYITDAGDMTAVGDIYANKVWDGVWNDLADFQDLADEYVPGKCYSDTLEGAKICRSRCQKSVIGILSDTFGFALGKDEKKGQAPFAVSGWVLAYVEDDCEPGDPLTNDQHGNLIRMSPGEKSAWPERLVAIYKRPETSDYWGPDGNKILVNGRHWVKVK